MGQTINKPIRTRRRLVDDFEEHQKKVSELIDQATENMKGSEQRRIDLEFKPFGGWNYSYGEKYQKYSSFTIWAFVTAGSLAVDWREAAIILGGSLWAQETIKNKGQWGSGASWVHNIQAGYCLYHYWFKNNKKMLVFLGVLAEAAGDIGAVIEEKMYGTNYSHYAHGEGLVIGLISAFLLDQMFKTKRALIQY